MKSAEYEKMEEGGWFAFIPGLDGLWATGPTIELARKELQEALVARNIDISSRIMYILEHGKWSGFECGGTARVAKLGTVAATAGGAGKAGANAAVAR